MLDARNIYRKVTRKIYDFSPSRSRTSWPSSGSIGGRPNKYLDLVAGYCKSHAHRGRGVFHRPE